MTDIAIRDTDTTEVAVAEYTPQPRIAGLVAWAEEARAAHSIAQSLARTSFVPAAFKGKPEEITAAILTGNEMGLSPMASLRAFDLIQGTPAMRANAIRGVVLSRGHAVWVDEDPTPTQAVVYGRRKDDDKVQRSVWTIERAREMGLTGKDNWRKQPQAMLLARATSEVCRMIASDVLYGVPYSAEELADEAEAAPKRTVQRRQQQVVPIREPEMDRPDPERADVGTEDISDDGENNDEPAEDTAWPTPAPIPGGES
ncbi:MAG: hypothetical protein HOQ45_18485 [Nocardioidaceae bacterium]|nr:hypothetical protein [Nocardioidaceae bacterium]